jgi:hypothetical protein
MTLRDPGLGRLHAIDDGVMLPSGAIVIFVCPGKLCQALVFQTFAVTTSPAAWYGMNVGL